MTARISLTKGYEALVDDDDLAAVLAAGSWQAYVDDERVYARRTLRRAGGFVPIQLHSFLTGWPLVDHRNGDGLDNRRANLRQATASQNQGNSRRRRDNTSGFKGVHLHRSGRWVAKISAGGTSRYLGLFASAEEAAIAYDLAAVEAWGEFARTNFPAT